MANKFTPGPWLVRPHYIGSLHSVVYAVKADGNTANIAIVKTIDAGIIAAAPELLKGCQLAIEVFAQNGIEDNEAIGIINYIIQKATK